MQVRAVQLEGATKFPSRRWSCIKRSASSGAQLRSSKNTKRRKQFLRKQKQEEALADAEGKSYTDFSIKKIMKAKETKRREEKLANKEERRKQRKLAKMDMEEGRALRAAGRLPDTDSEADGESSSNSSGYNESDNENENESIVRRGMQRFAAAAKGAQSDVEDNDSDDSSAVSSVSGGSANRTPRGGRKLASS